MEKPLSRERGARFGIEQESEHDSPGRGEHWCVHCSAEELAFSALCRGMRQPLKGTTEIHTTPSRPF